MTFTKHVKGWFISFVVLLILPFQSSFSHAYDFPALSPVAATVLGTPRALKAKVPRDIPVEEFELMVHPGRDVPDVL